MSGQLLRLGMTFPSQYGGLECSLLDEYPLYLELGRSLAPVPQLDTGGSMRWPRSLDAIDLHVARLLTLQGAWRESTGLPYAREAAQAKAAASRAAVTLAHRGHEVHAGKGFMMDYDLRLYTRRAKHWEWNLGDYRYHLERSLAEAGI